MRSPEYLTIRRDDPEIALLIDYILDHPEDIEGASRKTGIHEAMIVRLLRESDPVRNVIELETRIRKAEMQRDAGAEWLSQEARELYQRARAEGDMNVQLESLKLVGKVEGTLEDSLKVTHTMDASYLFNLPASDASKRLAEVEKQLADLPKLTECRVIEDATASGEGTPEVQD